jgi:hypothetical protein
MALAAMGDQRLRLGERAYGFRVFSALVATVAVAILVVGHWPQYYWSAAFGVLSTSAYTLWLLHSGARRRDALRTAGKLADTAPDYGVWRRLRYPIWTARAAELAREGHTDTATGAWRPLTLYESLGAARLAIRAEKRRPLVAKAVEQVIRGDHPDPKIADIAVRTLDLDRIATELERQVDYAAWAERLAPAISVPGTVDRDRNRREPHVAAASTRGAVGHSGRTRRRTRRTRIMVWRGQFGANPVGAKPIMPTGSTARMPVPTEGQPRTEQPRIGALVADAVSLLRGSSSSGDRQDPRTTDLTTVGNIGTDVGDDAVTADIGTEPVTVKAKTTALSETAATVAYWRERHPRLRPAEIAARVGRSERQVRRILATLDDIESPGPDDTLVPDLADSHRRYEPGTAANVTLEEMGQVGRQDRGQHRP